MPDRTNSSVLTHQLRLSAPEGARPGVPQDLHFPKGRSTVALHLNRARAAPHSRVQTLPVCSTTAHPMTRPVRPPCCGPAVATRAPGTGAARLLKSRPPGWGRSRGPLGSSHPSSALTWRLAGPMRALQGRGRAPGEADSPRGGPVTAEGCQLPKQPTQWSSVASLLGNRSSWRRG